jgi:antirestriction protein ArdC
MEQFPEAGGYYATLAHEATHSTGHHTRLDRFQRDAASAAFRGEAYSKEELIAEIGSAVIMHRLGLQTDRGLRNSAAYIQSWLGALRNDKRLIVSAASRAEKAVDLIMGADD